MELLVAILILGGTAGICWVLYGRGSGPTRCIGCGMCAAAVPEVFQIVGHVSTVQALPAPKRTARVADAANGCPVNAIRFTRG